MQNTQCYAIGAYPSSTPAVPPPPFRNAIPDDPPPRNISFFFMANTSDIPSMTNTAPTKYMTELDFILL